MTRQFATLLSAAAIAAGIGGPDHLRLGAGSAAPPRGKTVTKAHVHSRSALLDHLDARTATAIGRLLADRDIHMFQIRSVGAAVNATPADATAYAHRTQNFALSATINESRRVHAEQTWTELGSHAVYLGFETHGDATSLAKACPPATLARLRAVKAAYDPDNIFRTTFPISPLMRSSTSASNARSSPGDRRPDETIAELS